MLGYRQVGKKRFDSGIVVPKNVKYCTECKNVHQLGIVKIKKVNHKKEFASNLNELK